MASDAGHASTIAFGTSTFTAALLSINGWELSRESIETTTMATTTWKTFLESDLVDPGTLTVTFEMDEASVPPITATAAETITISWGGNTNTWTCSGFITGYSPSASGSEERMTADMTIKLTGEPGI